MIQEKISLATIAKRLGVSHSRVYYYVITDQIQKPKLKIGRGLKRYYTDDQAQKIMDFLKTQFAKRKDS